MRGRVALAALAGALGFGGWLVLRASGAFSARWSDGNRTFASETGNEVRHAVWDLPEAVAGLESEAADPALSPDGRWLVFVCGERGKGADLYVAERVDGTLREAEPLGALNTGADELAPAFGDGALYFASDRATGAGGLDLWRAPYAEGQFGEPVLVGPGVNSSADETDPSPIPGTRGLVFASDRALETGFDLYRTEPDARDFYGVPAQLEGLNSAADEREPAFAHDRRSLYFASDRSGGAGRFDLYRAVRTPDGFEDAAPVSALNTPGSERGPWVAADGFSLYFEAEAPDGARGLRLSRSLELFELPAPPVRTSEWILVAGLALLALLATLSKRWRGVEAQYKFLLASVVLHVLAMLYLNTISPYGTPGRRGTGDGARGEATIRLTVRPRGERAGSGGGGGRRAGDGRSSGAGGAALARASFGSSGAGPAEPSATLPIRSAEAASGGGPGAGPARERGALARPESGSAAEPRLEAPAEAFERFSVAAPELALSARAGTAASTPDSEARAPTRATDDSGAGGGLGRASPGRARFAGTSAADPGQGGPARGVLARSGDDEVAETPVAGPQETFVAPLGSSPAFGESIAPSGSAVEREAGRIERATFGSGGPAARVATPGNGAGTGLSPSIGLAGGSEAAPAPPRVRLGPADSNGENGALAGRGAFTEVRAPTHEGGPAGGGSSTGFDATAGLASRDSSAPSGSGRGEGGAGTRGPRRAAAGDDAPDSGGEGRALPGTGTTLSSALASADEGLAGAPGIGRLERSALATAGAAGPDEGSPGLRAPSDGGGPGSGTAAGTSSAGFDAMAGLASSPRRAASGALGAGPARAASGSGSGTDFGGGGATPSPALGLADLGGPGGSALDGTGPERLALEAPEGDSPGGAVGPSLRELVDADLDTGGGTGAPGSAEPFDAFAGFETAPRAREAVASGVPERARSASRSEEPAQPALQSALVAAPTAELDAPEQRIRAARPRLADTPYQNRFGELKLRALEEFGGSEETEHAVAAGLAYLARIQNGEGAWGQRSDAHEKYLDVRVGKSALALLAFLGAGHLPGGDGEHAAVAERALRYLLGTQDPETGHFGRSCSYGHGIATYALAECYALTRDEALRAPIERALAEVLRHQSRVRDPRSFGGWGYYFADGHVWNGDEWPRTSVTAWQVMALESARLGGLAVPDAALAGAREFLVNAWDAERRAFRYDHDPERLASGYPILPASTPAALFALSLLGVDPKARELGEARRFVLARAPDGYRYTGDDDFVHAARGNLYFWYYATLALFRVGGREWERWNAALQATLLPAQDEDGSWRPLDVYSDYAGDEDEERTYSTAMCVLSLEIYYRYFTPLLQVR